MQRLDSILNKVNVEEIKGNHMVLKYILFVKTGKDLGNFWGPRLPLAQGHTYVSSGDRFLMANDYPKTSRFGTAVFVRFCNQRLIT